jgi:hypothetical protein
MGKACSTHGSGGGEKKKKNARRGFVGKSERRRPLGRPTHIWKDNMKMDRGIEWGGCALDSSGSG